jgi:hypothetical protein
LSFGRDVERAMPVAVGSIVPALSCFNYITVLFALIFEYSKLLLSALSFWFLIPVGIKLCANDFGTSVRDEFVSLAHDLFVLLKDVSKHDEVAVDALDLFIRVGEVLRWVFVDDEGIP